MNDWETYSTIIDLIFYRVDLPVGNGTLVVDFHLNWLPFCPFGLRLSLWLLFFLFSFFFPWPLPYFTAYPYLLRPVRMYY